MKYWLGLIMNTLMAMSLLLGVVVLALWPVSAYRDAYFDTEWCIPAYLDRTDGPWYRGWRTEVDVTSGWMYACIFVDDLNRDSYLGGTIFNEDDEEEYLSPQHQEELRQLARDGYLRSTEIGWHNWIQADIQWFPEDNFWYDGRWGYEILRPIYGSFAAPLWTVASVLLLPAVFWFGFTGYRRRKLMYLRKSNVCLHCDYDLRGIESDECPECGEARAIVTV